MTEVAFTTLAQAFDNAVASKADVVCIDGVTLPTDLVNLILHDFEIRIVPMLEAANADPDTIRFNITDADKIPMGLIMLVDKENIEGKIVTATYGDLKKAYAKASESGAPTFVLDSMDFYTTYAKYLIEFLDGRNTKDETPLSEIFSK